LARLVLRFIEIQTALLGEILRLRPGPQLQVFGVTRVDNAAWLGKDGLVELQEGQSLSKQVIDIFSAVRTRIPRRVFLARWYPNVKDGEDGETAKLRLKQIRQCLKEIEKEEGTSLELVDMGTQTGTTFPIHARMYEAIASADIILIDLTGVRPNVSA
jgi:hypothetical protein